LKIKQYRKITDRKRTTTLANNAKTRNMGSVSISVTQNYMRYVTEATDKMV
jgi:hypothetical protein